MIEKNRNKYVKKISKKNISSFFGRHIYEMISKNINSKNQSSGKIE